MNYIPLPTSKAWCKTASYIQSIMQHEQKQLETGANSDQGLTPEQQRHGMRNIYWAAPFGSILFVLFSASPIGVLFVKRLGGSDLQALLPASLLLLIRFVQIPVSMKVAPRHGKIFMVYCWFIASGLIAIAFVIAFFLGYGQPAVISFLIIFLIAQVFNSSGAIFWFPMLYDIVPVNRRGRFFGRLRALWNTTSLILVLLSGLFIGKSPELWKFYLIFGIAILLFTFRGLIILKTPVGNSLAGDLEFDDWRHYIRQLLGQKKLLIFLGYYCILGFGMGFLGQPLVIYMKFRGIPDGNNIFIFCSSNVGMILSLLMASVVVDRLGTKKVFLATHIILCAACFSVVAVGMLETTAVVWLLPIVLVVSGGMIAMSGVACTAQLFHLIPNQGRAFFMCLSWIIISAGIAVSLPFVGWLLDITGEGWSTTVFSLKIDIFQLIAGISGIVMISTVGLLHLVHNYHPTHNRKPQ
jgi:MFS family permease